MPRWCSCRLAYELNILQCTSNDVGDQPPWLFLANKRSDRMQVSRKSGSRIFFLYQVNCCEHFPNWVVLIIDSSDRNCRCVIYLISNYCRFQFLVIHVSLQWSFMFQFFPLLIRSTTEKIAGLSFFPQPDDRYEQVFLKFFKKSG